MQSAWAQWAKPGSGGGSSATSGTGAAGDQSGGAAREHFVYGRVSADSDSDDGDGKGKGDGAGHRHAPRRTHRASAPGDCRTARSSTAGEGNGDAIAVASPFAAAAPAPAASTAAAAAAPAAGRSLAPLASVSSPLPLPTTSGSADAAADAPSVEKQPSFSALAAEARGGGSGSGDGDPAPQLQLTEDERRFGEALALAAAEDAARDAAQGAAADASDGEGGYVAGDERELRVYAVPLARDKIAFMPVVPWRNAPAPEARPRRSGGGGGLRGFVRGRVAAAADEAAEAWDGLKGAREGTLRHRLYQFGQRLLDARSAEERFMGALPRRVSRVVIYHPPQVAAPDVAARLSTMQSSYGVKAVGRAAVATVMLPLAVGVDLIVLPGPQVLSYYTAWQLWRNARGAVGTRRAAYVTQSSVGPEGAVRVDYVAEPRLEAAHREALESRDGVLPDDAIDALVAALCEPSLDEPLRELRRQRLRKMGRNVGGTGGRYAPLSGVEAFDADAGAGGDAPASPTAAKNAAAHE